MQTLKTQHHIYTSHRTSAWPPDQPWPYYDVRLNKNEAAILAWFLMTPMARHVEGFHYLESSGQHWARFTSGSENADMRDLVTTLDDPRMELLGWKAKDTQSLRAKLQRGELTFLEKQEEENKRRARLDARLRAMS